MPPVQYLRLAWSVAGRNNVFVFWDKRSHQVWHGLGSAGHWSRGTAPCTPFNTISSGMASATLQPTRTSAPPSALYSPQRILTTKCKRSCATLHNPPHSCGVCDAVRCGMRSLECRGTRWPLLWGDATESTSVPVRPHHRKVLDSFPLHFTKKMMPATTVGSRAAPGHQRQSTTHRQ